MVQHGNGGTARYQEIEAWLREMLLTLTPGDPLPSEAELAAQFAVSRMTARQAVQNLALEGLVQRRRGAGTFVAETPMHRHAGPLMSFTEDMRRRGKKASSKLLAAHLTEPDPTDIDALHIDEGTRVVRISRLRLADNVPLAIEHATLPAECAGVLAADLENGSLHQSLRQMGRTPGRAQSWISARLATANDAKLLDIAVRGPLLVERRVIYDTAQAPLEHTETVYAAERYVIDATFTLGEAHG